MNIHIKTLIVMLTAFMAAAPLAAQSIDANAGTSAGAFMKLGTGAPEAQALGNAFTALSHGTQALFWNPAGAATSSTREIQVSHMQYWEGVADSAVAYLQPMGKTVLGVTARYLRLDELDARDGDGVPIPFNGDIMKDFVMSVSLARSFFGILDLGATAKYINENNDGTKHTNAAFDLGAKLRLFESRVVLGLMGQNLGNKEDVPTAMRGGAAFNTKYFTLSGELVDYVDDKVRFGLGLAIHVPEEIVQVATFDLRIGYYDRPNYGFSEEGEIGEKIGLDTTSKITLGFGFYSQELFGYGVGFDYAMMPSGALGTAHQFSVRMQF